MVQLRKVILVGGLFLVAIVFVETAFSQTDGSNTSGIDLTPILVALINASFALVAGIATYLINNNVKNQQMATLLSNAVQNGLGYARQSAVGAVQRAAPTIPNIDPRIAAGVQYVLDNAQEAIAHFEIPTERIAQKIEAKLGLAEIETNVAATASPLRVIAHPLDPVPPVPSA
jgi:hypothetical protein